MSLKELVDDQPAADMTSAQSDTPSIGAGLRMLASGLIASGLACIVQALVPFAHRSRTGRVMTGNGRFLRREPHLGRSEQSQDELARPAPREARLRLRVGS